MHWVRALTRFGATLTSPYGLSASWLPLVVSMTLKRARQAAAAQYKLIGWRTHARFWNSHQKGVWHP
ncbi:MAG: hypothetical protein HOL33_01965 [Tateyamaria sp.]|nr:hypothetical protein [Tateyamaria sp.]